MEDLNLTIPFLSAELTTEILPRLPVKSAIEIQAFDLDSPIKNATESTYIVGSCNGLIFLVRSSKSSILWNPTIRKYSYLPGFRRRWEKTYARYGFGYDEIHDDYKVVGIFHSGSDSGGDSDDVEVQIYSLKSDVWTNVDGSYRKKRLNGSCLFETGKLHWNTNTTTNDRIIVSFDLGNETWETIEKPSYGEGEWDSSRWEVIFVSLVILRELIYVDGL
ncbi:hypothetical protein BC332_24461 [Capsicum chinense]|nr:hypothetical protein BC332_24461 [Capsicum chinense]